MARRWARVGSGAEIVVPVPVHAERERRRGYDQAALIAAVAAERLGLPIGRALERGRATVAQFELGRDERAANVAGAFRLRSGETAVARAIVGRWVLLVDDVVTTGATLAACAVALERRSACCLGDRGGSRTLKRTAGQPSVYSGPDGRRTQRAPEPLSRIVGQRPGGFA